MLVHTYVMYTILVKKISILSTLNSLIKHFVVIVSYKIKYVFKLFRFMEKEE